MHRGWIAAALMVAVCASFSWLQSEAQLSRAPAPEPSREDVIRISAAIGGARALRSGAKDPESFRLRSAVLKDSGAVCYVFRARNSYGAEMPGEAVLTKEGLFIGEKDGNAFVRAWNRECTEDGGKEVAPILTKKRLS